ncbi:tRNA 2-thiouridine synthesizing protein A [Microbulbifer donghaiensis]|uniref:tRNA 2-thiouridine synthesizing protein A n=1 Tax=Microbulbifer donghaiensis TaxID=494016 RepID=A0A1M5HB16_9GAMM|nr:sulfurtransferase TusA [Microbulbifer donghaiensis]SHG13169.1 tRNA 2-thiouridine synthesizing protein A [Microbulbifer donghaiensis]
MKSDPIKPDHKLDARGLLCPEPVMMLHAAVRKVAAGEVLQMIATDPSTQRDVPKFCQFLGYELVDHAEENDEFIYWIKKAEA